jgi:oligopeptide transport system substrate-binding protein
MDKQRQLLRWITTAIIVFSTAVSFASTWNNPNQHKQASNTRYSAFLGPPKTLDPARSYSSDEAVFTAQIYEPPLQYHLLKRPYELVPLTLTKMPVVTYYDKKGHKLPKDTSPNKVAYSVYDLYLKPGIMYQPHPAFAKDDQGQYSYHHLTTDEIAKIHTLKDFKDKGTRELTANDYVYQIKRLASPKTQSPILSLMSKYIVDLDDYSKLLSAEGSKNKTWLDLRKHPIEGAKVISPYHYQIKIKGVYPQFKYWLAMPFFAPIPWEVDKFYAQKGMKQRNLTFDWQPVGTGAYMLTENNPNKEMIIEKNPNYHFEAYPSEGETGDKEKGYLDSAGKQLPLTDRYIFALDKENIPRWNKFLQGYYDLSGIGADSFDSAVKIDKNGEPILTESMKKQGIRLETEVSPAIFYMGFNMLDKIVGGNSIKHKKLRQAIAIVVDYEEFISIFRNGRGKAAMGPIPEGIFGYKEGKKGINDIVYTWDGKRAKRKPITVAKNLLKEAGYPNGINPKTGKPLLLTFAATGNSPDDKARFNWLRKQFAKLGIKLNIETTQYNQFQKKIRTGNAQLFDWGWMADYPDPENFLFLLYGPNGKVKHGGENATNYSNPKFDALFNQIKNMPNGPARQEKINAALKILQQDSPWLWGYHPIDFKLSHQWNNPSKANVIANNLLKYKKSDSKLRSKLQKEWNQPILWPLWIFIGLVILIIIPLITAYIIRQHRTTINRDNE